MTTATYLPRVTSASYLHDYLVHIAFSDGREADIDLRPFVGEGVFEPLTDTAYFRKLFADGWSLCWPNGADLAPETLYELAEQANSRVNEK